MRTLLKIVLAWRGCRHRWQEISKIRIIPYTGNEAHTIGYDYHLRCTRCGDVKVRKLR